MEKYLRVGVITSPHGVRGEVMRNALEGEGVLDVSGVTLNGAAVNVETGELEVPVLGQVSLTME